MLFGLLFWVWIISRSSKYTQQNQWKTFVYKIKLCYMSPWSNQKESTLGQRSTSKKTCGLDEFQTWACNMVTWYWPADTLFWQKSNDHNIDVHYQRGMLQTEGACLGQPISWSMTTILCNSIAIAVVCTHPWAIPLVMITTRKSIHGFPFLSYMGMGLCLAVLWAAGALLLMSYVHMCCFDLWYIADTRSIQMNIWKIISFNCRERCIDNLWFQQCFCQSAPLRESHAAIRDGP